MTRGDALTRVPAVGSILAVAGVAGWISYRHAVMIVSVNGEPGAIGRAYPALIDGVIIAASMVLLDAARHEETAPRLAWYLLAAGIGATLAVNVLAGVAFGALGAIVSAWPAFAFVGCYELLMMLVRASARRETETADAAAYPQAGKLSALVPGSVEDAAAQWVAATVAVGNPATVNATMTRFGLTLKTAKELHRRVLAGANGHTPAVEAS